MENGIRVCAEGETFLSAEDACLEGAEISMEAKEYVWLKSQDSSILLMPDAVHMKAADIYIRSPESGLYPVFTEDSVERIFSMYEERKKSLPPLYASDGSLIRPEGYDDILYSSEMLEYFEKNVYGKGEYENPLGQPVQLFYDSWLEETYGKTELKQFWEYLGTADGIQDMLDVAGIFLEPADLLNAGISLCRGNWEEAAFNLVCVFPLVGDLIGKGGKGLKRVSSAGMETVLKRVSSAGTETVLKAVKTGEKVLDRLEITYKALSGKTEELKRYLDEVAEMMRNACRSGPEYRLCFEGGGYYLDEGTELFFKIVDDAGDSVSYTRRLGDAAEDGLDNALDVTRYVDEVIEGGKYTETEIKSIINNLKGDGFKNNPLRQAYENEVEGLKVYGDDLLASGMSEEQVAQTLNQARRDLGIKYKNATPQPLRDYIYEVNMRRYGDKLGPTYDWLVSEKGATNIEIINSSSRPNSNIDKLLSGFEEWLRRQ